MNKEKPILVVGLGNPKPEYALTRHNAGFIAVDILAGPDAKWKSEHKSHVTKGVVSVADGTSCKAIFAKPQTFMNLSGTAVSALMAFYKIPLSNLVVIHDDMDLKIGDIREKVGGGSAGHNGIKSIDEMVGREYRRIRLGVGHPRDTASPIDPSDWVLSKFSKEDIEKLLAAIDMIRKGGPSL